MSSRVEHEAVPASERVPCARTRNAQAVALASVPCVQVDALRNLVVDATRRGERLAALFGAPSEAGLELIAVLASDEDGLLRIARARLSAGTNEYTSITIDCPQAHLFEREIAEEWAVVPRGHPWLKPVRFVRARRAAPDAFGRKPDEAIGVGKMNFFRVEGEEVHEVAVGPVHAGVIEPGHFRFQCHGEHVFSLEISLGYQHRGVERAMVGGPTKRTVFEIETVAGDSTIGHAVAYAQLVEALSGTRVSARAHAIRGVALELERLANHVGTLGALAGDVAFLPTASFCGRLRGDYLNLTAQICGSRFGRSLVRPGGVLFDIEPDLARKMHERISRAQRDTDGAVELMFGTPSVQARFERTGRLSPEDARQLGLVGVAARACGLLRDVRYNFPTGIYGFSQLPVSVWPSGDVFARAQVRRKEVQRSAAFVAERLRSLPRGALCAEPGPLGAEMLCVSLVEGHRGEICHVAITDETGRFAMYKIVDPSFHNWTGLSLALRDQQISDFPLCNKSFDLSYCGFDL